MAFLLPLFVIHLLALMTPGPDFLIVSKTAMGTSRRAAFLTACGITLGVAWWVSLVLMGFHLLFERFAWLQTGIRLAGGAYLVYLGILMLKAALKKSEVEEVVVAPTRQSAFSAFRAGFVTNLANPKAIVYFGSIFATFLTSSFSLTDKIAVFFLISLESLAWFTLVALVFSLPAPRRAYQRANRWIDGIAGTAFAAFGVRLLLSSHH